jgi:acetate kinase
LKLDKSKTEQAVAKEEPLNTDDSRPRAFVIPTDEGLIIARDTLRCVQGEPQPS